MSWETTRTGKQGCRSSRTHIYVGDVWDKVKSQELSVISTEVLKERNYLNEVIAMLNYNQTLEMAIAPCPIGNN